MWELNFFAPLDLIQRVAPAMKRQRSGFIVNVGSIAGKVTLPWFTLYSASKYAIGSLTDGLRMELRQFGIHTMTVCPGYVNTRFQQECAARRASGAVRPHQTMGNFAGTMRGGYRQGDRTTEAYGCHSGVGMAAYCIGDDCCQRSSTGNSNEFTCNRIAVMNLKLKRTPGIYIVGFMGSGKTTVGRYACGGDRLAVCRPRRGHRALLSDKPISEIFLRPRARRSSARIEHEALSEPGPKHSAGDSDRAGRWWRRVHPSGKHPLLQENGITLWIDTDFEVMRKRVQNSDHRPLARDPERFERLYHERRTVLRASRVSRTTSCQ